MGISQTKHVQVFHDSKLKYFSAAMKVVLITGEFFCKPWTFLEHCSRVVESVEGVEGVEASTEAERELKRCLTDTSECVKWLTSKFECFKRAKTKLDELLGPKIEEKVSETRIARAFEQLRDEACSDEQIMIELKKIVKKTAAANVIVSNENDQGLAGAAASYVKEKYYEFIGDSQFAIVAAQRRERTQQIQTAAHLIERLEPVIEDLGSSLGKLNSLEKALVNVNFQSDEVKRIIALSESISRGLGSGSMTPAQQRLQTMSNLAIIVAGPDDQLSTDTNEAKEKLKIVATGLASFECLKLTFPDLDQWVQIDNSSIPLAADHEQVQKLMWKMSEDRSADSRNKTVEQLEKMHAKFRNFGMALGKILSCVEKSKGCVLNEFQRLERELAKEKAENKPQSFKDYFLKRLLHFLLPCLFTKSTVEKLKDDVHTLQACHSQLKFIMDHPSTKRLADSVDEVTKAISQVISQFRNGLDCPMQQT